MDWQALFEPHHVVENVIRASAIYLTFVVLLRLLPNRKSGSVGPTDLVVVVLLATAVSGALFRDVTSITDALVMVGTIVAWSLALDFVGGRVPFIGRLTRSEPVEVVRDGQIVAVNLRREFLTPEELRAQLRLQGVESERDVAHAYIEHDGRVSVIRVDDRKDAPPNRALG